MVKIRTHSRIWKCLADCIDFLNLFASLDNFFLEAGNGFVVSGQFHSLVAMLRRIHKPSVAELVTRREHQLSLTVASAKIDPNVGSFKHLATPTRVAQLTFHRAPRVAPPIVTSSSPAPLLPLEAMIPDVQTRYGTHMGPVFVT